LRVNIKAGKLAFNADMIKYSDNEKVRIHNLNLAYKSAIETAVQAIRMIEEIEKMK